MNANDAVTSWDFIKQNYQPDDRVALVIRNREKGYILQRLVSAQDAASMRMQRFLRYENAHGSDIYISMNTLNPGAKGRTKSDIAEIRHLYLDLDEDGDARLQQILESPALPRPNYVLDTSPGKHQVIWRVEGFTLDQSETTLRRMAAAFGGDPAATDAARVLRLPAFHNKKFAETVAVRGHRLDGTVHSHGDFTRVSTMLALERQAARSTSGRFRRDGRPLSQSERDWAWVRQELKMGADPEQLRQELARRRPGKASPEYYAARTISRALSRS